MECIDTFSSRGPRSPGRDSTLFTRQTIKQTLEEIGYLVSEHKSFVPDWHLKEQPFIEILGSEIKRVSALPMILSPSTSSSGDTGRVSTAQSIDVLDTYTWPRLAVLDEANNPIAYILSSERDLRVQPLPETAERKPHLIVEFSIFSDLLTRVNAGETVMVRASIVTESRSDCEIISLITSAPSAEHSVLVCAHYDSTFNSPGALDNGSGLAVALSLTRLAKSRNWPCHFAFFDGEELNKAGSSAYVQSLCDESIARISYVVEVDTVGAGKDIVFLCSKRISKLLRRIDFTDLADAGFQVQINPQSRISFSDVWPFMKKGVRVVRMLTRAPRGSGQGHEVIHSPKDTVDKVFPDTLKASFGAVARLLDHLCSHFGVTSN